MKQSVGEKCNEGFQYVLVPWQTSPHSEAHDCTIADAKGCNMLTHCPSLDYFKDVTVTLWFIKCIHHLLIGKLCVVSVELLAQCIAGLSLVPLCTGIPMLRSTLIILAPYDQIQQRHNYRMSLKDDPDQLSFGVWYLKRFFLFLPDLRAKLSGPIILNVKESIFRIVNTNCDLKLALLSNTNKGAIGCVTGCN